MKRFDAVANLAGTPDIRSWLYADAFLRHDRPRIVRAPYVDVRPSGRAPVPEARFWYREPGLWLPLSCAIARDGSALTPSDVFGTATQTYSVNPTGPNPIVWVAAFVDMSPTITLTATYNGVSMVNPTNAVRIVTGNAWTIYLFYITGITGAHNVVITAAGGTPGVMGSFAQVYSGAAQTSPGQPEASGNSAQTNNTTFNCTLTTSVANCWMIMYDIDETAGPPTSSGGSTLLAGTNGSLWDNGPYATPGSNSISATPTGFHVNTHVFAAFAPATGGGGSSTPMFYRRRR